MKINKFKLIELKAACKSAGAKGYTSLPKAELIEWIAVSPRSAEILAALPGATTIECMDEKSSIEESAGEEIEEINRELRAFGGEIVEGFRLSFDEIAAPPFECMDETEEERLAMAIKARAEAEKKARARYGHDCSRYALDENGEILCHGSGPIEYSEEDLLEEGTDPDAGAKSEWIQRITSLSSRLGAEADGVTRKVTGKGLTFCSVAELQKVFSRLAQLSQLVGTDDSEPIPDDELSEDEREANAFGAKFVADFLEGDGAAPEPEPFPYKWEDLVELKFAVPPVSGIALSVRQPWCWAIFFAEKDIENRTWATDYRGPLWIHASKTYDHKGAEWLARKFGERIPGPDDLPLGAIVGRVDLVDCSQSLPVDENGEENSWAIPGQFFWKLVEAFPCTPIPYKGQLGLFKFELDAPQPPPQHLRDRAMGITNYDEKQPNGTGFCPSNGTIGDIWESLWCKQCSKFTQAGCPIYIQALAGEPPAEWLYWDGAPLCTGFDEGTPPEESITPPPPPEASTACPIFYPGDVVCRFIENYLVVGPDKERPGNWLLRSQEFPEGGQFSLNLLWNHLRNPSPAYQFPKNIPAQFTLWNLAINNSHKIRLLDGWENRDIAARLQDAGFEFANRIWDFCEFNGYEYLFSEFATLGHPGKQWVVGRSGCAIVVCFDPNLFLWQIESQDLDFWINQIKSWLQEWEEPVLVKPWRTPAKAIA
jgi:hypothetical protein